MPVITQLDLSSWFTPPVAAKRLGVSRQRVHQLIQEGNLTVAVLPTGLPTLLKYLIAPDSLEARLSAQLSVRERRRSVRRRTVCMHDLSAPDSTYGDGRCRACQDARCARYHQEHREERLQAMRKSWHARKIPGVLIISGATIIEDEN